jgi:Tfp pilus assembly protein FimT
MAYNNDVSSDIPYSTTYTASFSGTVSYWQTTGASGNTYVLASDGTTQRINTLDGNVAFTQITPDTIAFKVFNSAASALAFSIGVDVGGV